MRVSFQFSMNRRYDFDFGFDTAMWSSMYWFTIIKADLNNTGEVEYASIRFSFLRYYKYWFKK